MCGIAGIVALAGTPPDPAWDAQAASMAACLEHRGPDDHGVWRAPSGTAVLAHRRLSIVDLSPLGHNPMPWDDGRLWITFNGEIFNYLDLRRELEAAGHRFRSHTDTEVILAAYDEWGLEAVHRLVGMFAFALWDEPRRRLWIARDRLGKKPLYYSEAGRTLRFASELKSIARSRSVPLDLDRASLGLYLRYGYVPSPRTIYAHVRKLPPAHMLVVEDGRVVVTRYWEPLQFALNPRPVSEPAAVEELESLLSTAVRQRMIADVPLGAFLSGGIDSSLIVALMREHASEPVRTFTIRFDRPEFNEASHAAAVARHLGTAHHEDPCGEAEMLQVVDRLPAMYDEPFADSSAVPTYLVSRAARRQVTVALSGDGGDELFFGYPRYAYHARAQWLLSLPGPLRHALGAAAGHLPTRRLRRAGDVLLDDDGDTYARFVSWCRPGEVASLTGDRADAGALYGDLLARAQAAGLPRDDQPALLDLVSYLPEDILTKVDRASMAVSLEVRSPLLDHRVVEFALALPRHLKWHAPTGKTMLRRLLYRRVPRTLVDRPKVGFGVPLEPWFRGPLRARMAGYCDGPIFESIGLEPRVVQEMWTAFLTGRSRRADVVWQLFMLAAWAEHPR